MGISMEDFIQAILIGIGATIVMDLWALLQKLLFGIPPLNYALVGRWAGHIFKGKFSHVSIMHASPVIGESAFGWFIHYLIGGIFSVALFIFMGKQWLESPELIPAVAMGITTVLFPFFLMQPCFGMGIAASKLPIANTVRFRSLVAHISFGIGLYISARIIVEFQLY